MNHFLDNYEKLEAIRFQKEELDDFNRFSFVLGIPEFNKLGEKLTLIEKVLYLQTKTFRMLQFEDLKGYDKVNQLMKSFLYRKMSESLLVEVKSFWEQWLLTLVDKNEIDTYVLSVKNSTENEIKINGFAIRKII